MADCGIWLGISIHRRYDFQSADGAHVEAAETEKRVKAWLETAEGKAWLEMACKVARGGLDDCKVTDGWTEAGAAAVFAPTCRK